MLTLGAAIVQAQYPTKPITVVLPFTTGGGGDTALRQITPILSSRLKVPVVIESRVGAGGQIGIMHVVNSAPDGYTILFMSSGIGIDPAIKLKPAYDPLRDLRPLTLAYVGDQGIFVNPQLPVNSVKELIAYAKANPGKLNYSFPGIGSTGHLNMELLKQAAQIDVVAVPFKGSPEALSATMAGDTQITITEPATSRPLWQAGRIKLLAIGASQRSPVMPNIPTVSESGLPGYLAYFWYGFFTPAAVPGSAFEKLESELTSILRSPEMREKIMSYGYSPSGIGSDEFKRRLTAEIKQWQELVQKAGIPRQ